MARKPRMGRNLNALLNSAVKERREQPDETRTGAAAPAGDVADEVGRDEAAARVPVPADDRVPDAARARSPAPQAPDASSVTPIGAEAGVAAPASGPGNGTAARTDASSVRALRPDGPFARTRASGAGPSSDSMEGAAAAPAPTPAGGDAVPVGPGASGPAAGAARPTSARSDEDRGASPDRSTPPAPEPSVARVVRGDDVDDLPVAPGDPPRPGDRLRMIGVERVRRGVFQPRRFFDQEALQELADSLKAQGMIQPIIVRPFGGAFELIAGERRWRAAQIAGLTEVPAIVREMEDRTVAAVSLIENIQREDLNPLEEAQALTRLCDEFGMTHASVAESIGRSRASVSNLMRLLDLHDEVKVLVDKGELDMGHARALLRVPKVDQPALALRVAKQGLTVRAVEKLIRTGADKGPGEAAAASESVDPDVRRLEERLSGVLGAPVSIRQKAGGAGRLEIRYTSLDELEGILEHIK